MFGYEEAYARNIGLFTPQEQLKLRSAKVAIAGAGGVGGIQAATLARFGIGRIALADPGIFDMPDLNRQFGAAESTLGRNKAEATVGILADIAPFTEIQAFPVDLGADGDLSEFLAEADIVVDAIDYAGFEHKVRLAKATRERGLHLLSAPIPDYGALLMIFAPDGITYEDFFEVPDGEGVKTHMPPANVYYPAGHEPRNLVDFLSGRLPYISTCAGAAALCGGLLASEVAFIVSGKRDAPDIVVAPNVTYLDPFTRVLEVLTVPKRCAAPCQFRGHD